MVMEHIAVPVTVCRTFPTFNGGRSSPSARIAQAAAIHSTRPAVEQPDIILTDERASTAAITRYVNAPKESRDTPWHEPHQHPFA